MFELLLQADKALTEGSFDQAERTYWQLIDLDPTNAMAVAGLARVSLQRGDERSARTFADQALGIDPDSIAARRVLAALEHAEAGPAEPKSSGPADLPLLGAARLEALSRRRGKDGAAAPAAAPKTARAERVGKRAVAPKREVVPLPSEPLPERRRAGRLAAAAAAAAAAAREPISARREHHHAMPVGRRFFGPEGLKAPLSDAFSDAEMAAAVAAVDALDEPGLTIAEDRRSRGQADVLGAVDATAADESVALRLALMANVIDLEAAERGAAESVEPEAGSDDFEAAAAEVAEPLVGLDADVKSAAEDEADASAAEAAAVAEAVNEVAGSADDFDPVRAPRRTIIKRTSGEEPSEEEAEAEAFREAIAIVLEGNGESGAADGPSATIPSAKTHVVEGSASAKARDQSTENAAADPPDEPTTGSKPSAATETDPDSSSRKRGIFHRIRGS